MVHMSTDLRRAVTYSSSKSSRGHLANGQRKAELHVSQRSPDWKSRKPRFGFMDIFLAFSFKIIYPHKGLRASPSPRMEILSLRFCSRLQYRTEDLVNPLPGSPSTRIRRLSPTSLHAQTYRRMGRPFTVGQQGKHACPERNAFH